MQIEELDINNLMPYARNSRTHSEEQVLQIASSIKEFGFNNPVLIDQDGGIIAGHGRVLAARKIGLEKIPTIKLVHLTETQKRAYIIADNKIALNAGWDDEMLKLEIEELNLADFDIDLVGFSEEELGQLLNDPEEEKTGLTEDDVAPELPINHVTVFGDLWLLGNHRLLCGDSTSISAIERLMNGKAVDIVFTDPPYNVGFNGRSGKHDVIKNDALSKKDFEDFIGDMCRTITTINPKVYYIWCNWNFYGILQDKLDYKACIVWAKNVFGLGNGYRHQHEFCLFNGKIDEEIKNESDLWEVKKDIKYVHPTQKPVALSVRAFGNHIKLLNVLDLFAGSGSTLIGAEQTGRTAHLMELDPKYCDVIIKRWQDYTGQQAILESTGETFDSLSK